ncbi:hypothetical protein VTJ04DRAFT_4669 [Mycothermus thermophilus]|uniref:uncharacterized protein n=1 Tax=Humicola insolens TaxID=85995 RepID=UPI00374398B5
MANLQKSHRQRGRRIVKNRRTGPAWRAVLVPMDIIDIWGLIGVVCKMDGIREMYRIQQNQAIFLLSPLGIVEMSAMRLGTWVDPLRHLPPSCLSPPSSCKKPHLKPTEFPVY